MILRRSISVFAMALALAGSGAAVVACSHAKVASVTPGPMPDGEEWTGVYYNPVYGYAHLIEKDGKIWGRYKWSNQSRWGEISGTTDGNVMHFDWTEYDVNPVAPGEARKGHGYWVYSLNKDHIGSLKGQYGLDDNETGGGDWNALKMKNMKPDPDSVKADVKSDVPVAPDAWDDGGSAPPPDDTTPEKNGGDDKGGDNGGQDMNPN